MQQGGGVIAHEPVVDWLPDDVRRSLLSLDRLDGLESSHNYTGGIGGLEYHKNATAEGEDETAAEESSIHDVNLLLLFSHQWRKVVCYGASFAEGRLCGFLSLFRHLNSF